MELLGTLDPKQRVLIVYVEGGEMANDRDLEVEVQGTRAFNYQAEVEGREEQGTEMEGRDGQGTEVEGREEDMSEEDSDYTPSQEGSDDDEVFDGLADDELVSDDDEYVQSRRRLANRPNVFQLIDDDVRTEQDLVGLVDVESDYGTSEGDVDSSETDEEAVVFRGKKKKIVYDPKCNHKDLDLSLGLRFQNGWQCRDAIQCWAIENHKRVHFKRVSDDFCEAYCKKGCPWRIYASRVRGDGSFKIKTIGGRHRCAKAMNNKLMSSNWIAKRYINVFRVRPQLSMAELREDIWQRYATKVHKDRLYRARLKALELIRGTVNEHYALIRRYLAENRRVDPEGRFELLLAEGHEFKGLYMGYSSLRKGFKAGCRPVVGLDGCHLKTFLGGVLLCAIGKDGNNQMYPIAWAAVEIENEHYWTWFMKCLVEDLQIGSGDGWTFISDQQKGLEAAVNLLVPYVEHRNCARHVYMNWKK